MAIFKAITSVNGKPTGHSSPEKLEKELKFKYNEQHKEVLRTDMVSALNADKDDFAESCEDIAAHFNTCHKGSLQYKHYIQCFPSEDCNIITQEKCHEIGVEFAQHFWSQFPVLIVTHHENGRYDNHFVVYNCNVNNGRKIDTSHAQMWEQKRFVASQIERYGLTLEGLVFENTAQT